MTIELERKIFYRFPFYHPELSKSVSLMCYGFGHDDGWFDIIWELSEKIEKAIEDFYTPNELAKAYLSEGYTVNVFQVKEKFGTLRFYIDCEEQELYSTIQQLVDEAEDKSASTCEYCGKPGKVRRDRWIKVICDTCVKKAKGKEKHAKRIARISNGAKHN